MKKQLLSILRLVLITTFLFGCIKSKPTIKITNQSKKVYDSIQILTSSLTYPTVFKKVKHGDIVKGNIHIDPDYKADGTYLVRLFNNGVESKKQVFGYFTNGGSLNSGFDITIEKDSLIIRSH